MKISYRDAGVDVDRGQEAVRRMKDAVMSTFNSQVLMEHGAFAGLFSMDPSIKDPVLVAGTDGVGTKLLLGDHLGLTDGLGTDLVAMSANDVLCHGAKPLFFLDYLATGKLEPECIAKVVAGIAEACKSIGAVLLGGETAEMPGLYEEQEIDMAGFLVGVVERSKIINGKGIQAGDVIVGLASEGFHSNGYSLLRKLFVELHPELLEEYGEKLMQPTKLYVREVLALKEEVEIKGLAHITGGGFYENLPRMLPKGLSFDVRKDSWQRDPIFDKVKELSGLDDEELFATFNMGIGMAAVVDAEDAQKAIRFLANMDLKAYVIGEVIAAEEGVIR